MTSRQFPSFLRWLVVLSLLVLASSRENYICGGSPCEACYPPGQRTAPGVGIDLTMEYATAAVHFKNGTTHDLVKIDGSAEYRAAMRQITQDASDIRNGLSSSLEQVHFEDPTWRNPYPISKYWKSPWAWWYNFPVFKRQLRDYIYGPPPPHVYFSDDWIVTISTMLSKVKYVALDPLHPPLEFHDVYLTWPDALYDTSNVHSERFSLACHLAGLRAIRYTGTIVSKAALELEGVDFYQERSDPAPPTAILVVSYNAASVGITRYYTDEWGFLEIKHAVERPEYGSEACLNQKDSGQCWTGVRELIQDVLAGEVVDYALLLGSHSNNPRLLTTLKEILPDDLLPELGLQEDKDRLVFLGARAAAEIAKVGMESNFQSCWQPAWCVPDEEDPVRHVKSEL